jgi:hypothetical protein
LELPAETSELFSSVSAIGRAISGIRLPVPRWWRAPNLTIADAAMKTQSPISGSKIQTIDHPKSTGNRANCVAASVHIPYDLGMDIFGIDFTSAPKRRKSITCLQCKFDGAVLRADRLEEWPGFQEFGGRAGKR